MLCRHWGLVDVLPPLFCVVYGGYLAVVFCRSSGCFAAIVVVMVVVGWSRRMLRRRVLSLADALPLLLWSLLDVARCSGRMLCRCGCSSHGVEVSISLTQLCLVV